jgi:hypothetical protein
MVGMILDDVVFDGTTLWTTFGPGLEDKPKSGDALVAFALRGQRRHIAIAIRASQRKVTT